MIKSHSIEAHADALAAYMPGGRYFAAKNISGSVFRKFLEGLAVESRIAESLVKAYLDNYLPDSTVNFLDEWERLLAIPDDCFTGEGTLGERRFAVLTKLAAMSVQTTADFERVASIFGLTVNCIPGVDSGYVAPIAELRFTIVIEYVFEAPFVFPLEFPIIFGSPSIPILTCLYQKIKPANCQIIFFEV